MKLFFYIYPPCYISSIIHNSFFDMKKRVKKCACGMQLTAKTKCPCDPKMCKCCCKPMKKAEKKAPKRKAAKKKKAKK